MDATRARLDDGRWHFQHGPIDLVIGADGDADAVQAAHEAAWRRFRPLLGELVAELPLLRQPVGAGGCPLRGAVARSMWDACRPHAARFVTPMAAVAGAVADALIGCYRGAGIERAWVNDGGDIALHLAPGRSVKVGVYADLARFDASQVGTVLTTDGRFDVDAAMPVRGVATSGWRGRSFSLGIADSVTVLAATAAQADAAATMVANEVDVDSPRVGRRPARELKDDCDLGDLPVTVRVDPLDAAEVDEALRRGARHARALCEAGLIHAAWLVCQGRAVACGPAGGATIGASPVGAALA